MEVKNRVFDQADRSFGNSLNGIKERGSARALPFFFWGLIIYQQPR